MRTQIAKNPEPGSPFAPIEPVKLKIADLDNNGGLDLIVMSALQIDSNVACKSKCNFTWLNDGNGKFDLLQGGISDDRVV